jgi:formylglycine-generating enzyme required for sulfatase activity
MNGRAGIDMSSKACLATIAIVVLTAAACAEPESGDEFRDCEACPSMVRIATGTFAMGAPDSERNRDDDEGPVRDVSMEREFAMAKSETSWSEWQACMDDGACVAPTGHSMPEGSDWGKGTRPVITVSWSDAQAYVSWISEKTGRTYRLPTEAEWEYVARAGAQSRYQYGDDPKTLCRIGNGADLATNFNNRNDCYDRIGRETAPGGSFEPNAFGLFDMIGNVWEWTEDCWNTSYHSAPISGEAWRTGDCSQAVIRGGSWGSYPHNLRFATRQGLERNYRGHEVGFRVAADVQGSDAN